MFEEETWNRVYEQLSKAIDGKFSLDYHLAQKKPTLLVSPVPIMALENRVLTDNHGSDFYTILEIYTHDRLGLLYTITKTLSESELNIHFAKISTKVDQVVDVFYVTDLDGQKIYDQERIEEIEKAILFALKSQGGRYNDTERSTGLCSEKQGENGGFKIFGFSRNLAAFQRAPA